MITCYDFINLPSFPFCMRDVAPNQNSQRCKAFCFRLKVAPVLNFQRLFLQIDSYQTDPRPSFQCAFRNLSVEQPEKLGGKQKEILFISGKTINHLETKAKNQTLEQFIIFAWRRTSIASSKISRNKELLPVMMRYFSLTVGDKIFQMQKLTSCIQIMLS